MEKFEFRSPVTTVPMFNLIEKKFDISRKNMRKIGIWNI